MQHAMCYNQLSLGFIYEEWKKRGRQRECKLLHLDATEVE